MDDKWEMCEIFADQINIYTPIKHDYFSSIKGFLKGYSEQVIGQVIGGANRDKAICLLLSEGWEPYGATDKYDCLRRKFRG